MKSAPVALCAAAIGGLAISCGGSPAAPASPVHLAGAWNGTGNDSQGTTIVNWSLTQNGGDVSGTVTTRAVDPADGSCNSCHRNKSGTVSGTMSANTLSLTMVFAAGVDGDPTPACSATLTGSVASVAADSLSGTYTGADTCEGPFANGTLTMGRRP